MHAAKQHRAEHHLLAAAAARHHLSPGQMAQTGHAYPQPSCVAAQPVVQRLWQNPLGFLGQAAVTAHLAQPKRRGGLINVGQHGPEERLMRLGASPQAHLRDQIAERLRGPQFVGTPTQHGPHLGMHHLRRRVVPDQMVLQAQQQPAFAARLACRHQPYQCARLRSMRCLRGSNRRLSCSWPGSSPSSNATSVTSRRPTPDHLGGAGQPRPDDAVRSMSCRSTTC